MSVCPSAAAAVRRASVQKLAPIPAVVSENVTNKSCLVCDKSEKYPSWVTLRPQSDRCCRGEAELRIYNLKKTSPTQSRSQAVVCVSTPRMYP